ncbi:MAG: redox-regulated ATPase YchF [Bacillota bacterium]|nr:redox-regulated ATPase YchF [Bacillota bacterium]
MGFSCGIVGLPNAGKSTVYNAITRGGALVAGYPFSTVDRNVGTTLVPDPRLNLMASFAGSSRVTPTSIEVVDIAGLVRGASRGEGLGNKFLGHIRDVDAVLHVVRCFDNPASPHVLGEPDPLRDAAVVVTELCLADIAALERRRERMLPKARAADVAARHELAMLEELIAALDAGREIRLAGVSEHAAALAAEMRLLTTKPVVFVANVPDPDQAGPRSDTWAGALQGLAEAQGAQFAEVSSRVLADLGELDEADRQVMAEALGVSDVQTRTLIVAAYRALALVTFFTANRHEARAWTVRQGSTAVQAAAKVHSDFARGFIAAEVISAQALAAGITPADTLRRGLLRLEGRDYEVRDGDLVQFRFNV